MIIRTWTAAGALVLVACTSQQGDVPAEDTGEIPPPPYNEATLPADSPPSAGTPGAPQPAARPAVKSGVVMLEGTPDTMELRLVHAPDEFPLQFSTYIPPDMTVETTVAEDGGHSLRVVAEFGGVRNEQAYVQFHFYPRGTTRAGARNAITGFLSGLNPEVDRSMPAEPPPWGIERTRFTYANAGRTIVGSVVLAERGDVLFHAVAHFPAEYGDGMGPRVETIMREWRWADGEALTP